MGDIPLHSPLEADDLERLIAVAQSGQGSQPASDATHSDAAFVRQLIAAARSATPEASFDLQLRARLRAGGRKPAAAAVPQRQASERALWLFAGALVSAGLILVSATAWSAAGYGASRFAGLPAWRAIASSISLAPPPPGTTIAAPSTRAAMSRNPAGADALDTPPASADPVPALRATPLLLIR